MPKFNLKWPKQRSISCSNQGRNSVATLPNITETTRAILDAIATYKARPGDIVPIMGIRLKLDEAGFHTDELTEALEDMINKGLIEISNGTFIKLTKTGFSEM